MRERLSIPGVSPLRGGLTRRWRDLHRVSTPRDEAVCPYTTGRADGFGQGRSDATTQGARHRADRDVARDDGCWRRDGDARVGRDGDATRIRPYRQRAPHPAGRGAIDGGRAVRKIAPGGTTGWHSHPGKTLVLVSAGKFTLYRDRDGACRTRTYDAGQGFVEPPTSVHKGVNEGDVPVELTAVFFRVPADGTTPRIRQPLPIPASASTGRGDLSSAPVWAQPTRAPRARGPGAEGIDASRVKHERDLLQRLEVSGNSTRRNAA